MPGKPGTSFKDYYTILGVGRNADAAAIKSRYRDLAKEFHPDSEGAKRLGKDAAKEKFIEVSEAYTCLFDEKTRADYDRIYALRLQEQEAGRTRKETPRAQATRPRQSEREFGQFRQTFNFDKFMRDFDEMYQRNMKDFDQMIGLKDTPFEWQSDMGTKGRAGSNMPTAEEVQAYQRKTVEDAKKAAAESQQAFQEQETAQRRKILETEAYLPESDVYLVAGMTRLLRDRSLKVVKIQDAKGSPLWEIKINRRTTPPIFDVRRSLEDYLGSEGVTLSDERQDGGFFGNRLVNREVKPGQMFPASTIDRNAGYASVEGRLPRGFGRYIGNLESLAFAISDPEKFSLRGTNEATLLAIDQYLDENNAVVGETRETRINAIESAVNERRFQIIPEPSEGRFRNV